VAHGRRSRFEGHIAGVGSESGVRVVVGRWDRSPFGPFADVMVEDRDGHRVLLAPDDRVADLVASVYRFDEVRLEPVSVTGDLVGYMAGYMGAYMAGDTVGEMVGERTGDAGWTVSSPSLALELSIGGPTPIGRVLRCVPRRVSTSPPWCTVTDPVARLVLHGVRTRGRVAPGTTEYYGATDLRAVTRMRGAWDGRDLGGLRPVDPPCRFGFSSTPRRPSVSTVVTTVVEH
jgi:hypothetical protein